MGKTSKRNQMLLKKKSKRLSKESPKKNPGTPSISQLLGRRRCAAEASEKIARVAQETSSGHSSGSESNATSAAAVEPPRTTRSGRVSKPVSVVEEVAPATSNHHQSSSSSNSKNSDLGARNKRRRAVDDDIYSMFNPTMLEDLLNAMMKHRDGWPFDRPITKADAPDYYRVVKRPIDLGTIRSAINRMKYSCNNEVLVDIRLVFENCRMYNKEDAEEYQCGERLERYFNREIRKLGLLLGEDDVDEEVEIAHRAKKRARRTL
jgi:bromodomain adjacent to zinc finger domain protein 1A